MELVPIPGVSKVKDTTRPFFRSSSEASKYRDPLHHLLDRIAEVSRTDLASRHCCMYARDLSAILPYSMQQTPDCGMILIHDDDLGRIDGIGDGTVSRQLISSYVSFSSLRSMLSTIGDLPIRVFDGSSPKLQHGGISSGLQ